MRFIILFITIFIVFAAFLGNINIDIANPLLAFIFYLLNIFVKFFLFFLFGFCILFGFLIWQHYAKKHHPKKALDTFIQIVEVIIISVFSAFVLLLFIAFIELNVISLMLNSNPKALGVKTDTLEILNAIKENNIPPEIIVSDKNSKNEVAAIAKATSGTSNFYGSNILTAVPSFLILPIKKTPSNLLFLDNTLVVTGVNVWDMRQISPLIGYLFVQNYFPLRQIKSFPKVTVMNENTYQVFRESDVKKKLEKINSGTESIETSISSISATIDTDKKDIAKNTQDQGNVLKQRDKQYNSCLSEGAYKSNVFYPKNTKEFCQKIIDEWEDDFVKAENDGKILAKKLSDDSAKLKEYQAYDAYFKAQKKLTDVSTENITSELGVFEPKDLIKIVVLNSNSNSIADYFETLSHEYLHYASYVDGKRLDSAFFEEGLTEYFARQTINDNMKVNTNIGYPITIKIIEELTKKIPETDLADIYFNKDQAGLERTLNLVYGDNFYKNNIVLLESLQYAPDSEEALDLANTFMRKIGGAPLTKKDLLSTQSDL